MQSVTVYLLAKFAVLRVARSNRAGCASLTNVLCKCLENLNRKPLVI